jgi:hypothetical protein
LRCVRCPFKRKGAARQTQERREAKQRQKLQELVGAAKLASKAKVKAALILCACGGVGAESGRARPVGVWCRGADRTLAR